MPMSIDLFDNFPATLSGFAKSLLEVGDDFERAIQAAPQKGVAVADAEAALKTLVEGILISTAHSVGLYCVFKNVCTINVFIFLTVISSSLLNFDLFYSNGVFKSFQA